MSDFGLDLGDLDDAQGEPAPEQQATKKPMRAPRKKALSQSRKREGRPMHAQDTWDNYNVHEAADKPWKHSSSLDAPPPRPGFKQRWIRVAVYGQEDATNAMRRMREGWKPRPKDSIPANFPLPTIQHGEWAGCVGVEGMVLCEMPEAMVDKRNEFYRNKTERITNSIEQELQAQSDPRMPMSQSRNSESKLVRTVKVAPDE